jgi:hypothetical protein
MSSYIVFITCLTGEYHKQLPSLLLEAGYEIKAGYDNGMCFFTKGIVTNICYMLTSNNNDSVSIRNDVKICLEKMKAYYYAIVVFSAGESAVCLGNINGETDPSRVLQLKSLW